MICPSLNSETTRLLHPEAVRIHQHVGTERADACQLRISLPMGISFNGHAGAIDWIQARFQKQKPATLYYDEIRTPTYTDCLNLMLHDILCRPIRGIFHSGGPRQLSLYAAAWCCRSTSARRLRHSLSTVYLRWSKPDLRPRYRP